MSKSARSLFVFGLYLFAIGFGFLLVPNMLLGLFGIPPTTEVYIRIVGMLLIFLGYYDVQSARIDHKPFFQWSVYLRASVILFLTAFVLLGMAPASLILFGVIDLAGAIWTQLALRSERNA